MLEDVSVSYTKGLASYQDHIKMMFKKLHADVGEVVWLFWCVAGMTAPRFVKMSHKTLYFINNHQTDEQVTN